MMDDFVEVDKFLDEYDGESAYKSLQKQPAPDKAEYQYRLAHACYIRANQEDVDEKRIELLREAREHALKAVEIDPENGEVWKWAATVTGVLAEHLSLKEKVSLGKEFKTYLDKAIEKLPDEITLLHMRGRFIFQIANLSMIERAFVAMFYESLPEASYEMALEDLLKMEEISPGDLDNQLYIGKVYHAMGNTEKAKEWLNLLCDAVPVDAMDQEHISEAVDIMEKIVPGFKETREAKVVSEEQE
ncbi:unnamed protein product [Bursaphelenchus xylophilus]|uniref:(pine wood nematode) hypothetical protein n=1 Tax=Bursaphelenchus xylophilus TaxID=6326 RepID=A0A1I7S2N7_BURXY|nr:unnamed protein product [Bursaphelenchus xylophilus]CAG9121787.1 unnamed protein product [Bursaphelenchus xylophilus]